MFCLNAARLGNKGVADTPGGPLSQVPCGWVQGYSKTDIMKLQKEDADLGVIINWLQESETRPPRPAVTDMSPAVRHLWLLWEQLFLHEGILYKLWFGDHKSTTRWQLLVPKTLQAEVMGSLHNSVTAGHLGYNKTVGKVKQNFYWYKLKESVHNWVRRCAKCGARKSPSKKYRAALGTYNVGAPMDRVATDILGPFPVSDRGNRYVLLVCDQFTKWTEAYAIPDYKAHTVAAKLVDEFFSRFGPSLELHSDQGSTYESVLFKEVCKLLDIHKTRTTPFHPSSNGMVERFNRTLLDMIAMYIDENQKDWDCHLPLLTAAY